jgi:hypothetical protein
MNQVFETFLSQVRLLIFTIKIDFAKSKVACIPVFFIDLGGQVFAGFHGGLAF